MKIEEHKIYDEDGKGYTRVVRSQDVEFVDPVEYYSKFSIYNTISNERDLLMLKDPVSASMLDFNFFYSRAVNTWKKRYQAILATVFSLNFIQLLSTIKKREQIKLLRNQSLTSSQLIAFLFKASLDLGFTFSQYSSEHLQKGLDKSSLPKLIHIDKNEEVQTVGRTKLSKGKLKQIIVQRKIIIAKFLDKGDSWHCFIVTGNSLAGNEAWNDGQSHFHYLSDKWGVSREEVITRIKSGHYPKTPVHIGLWYSSEGKGTSVFE